MHGGTVEARERRVLVRAQRSPSTCRCGSRCLLSPSRRLEARVERRRCGPARSRGRDQPSRSRARQVALLHRRRHGVFGVLEFGLCGFEGFLRTRHTALRFLDLSRGPRRLELLAARLLLGLGELPLPPWPPLFAPAGAPPCRSFVRVLAPAPPCFCGTGFAAARPIGAGTTRPPAGSAASISNPPGRQRLTKSSRWIARRQRCEASWSIVCRAASLGGRAVLTRNRQRRFDRRRRARPRARGPPRARLPGVLRGRPGASPAGSRSSRPALWSAGSRQCS